MSDPSQGDIPLYDPTALGLWLDTGRIGLYPYANYGWMVGVHFMGTFWGSRQKEATSGFMTLQEAEFRIPGPGFGERYKGRIAGWEHYKTFGSIVYKKAKICSFLPDHEEYTTFAMLDAFKEKDPYFYYGWGSQREKLTNPGTHHRVSLARFGVNYPVKDDGRPGWHEIPDQETLRTMLKASAPAGDWEFEGKVSGFTVDPDVSMDTYIDVVVWQGQQRYHRGVLDCVPHNQYAVGERDADWEGINWGTWSKPGTLKMLSGQGKDRIFAVGGTEWIGSDPPSGWPSHIWAIKVGGPPFAPSWYGIKAGDEFLLTGSFYPNAIQLYKIDKTFGPGVYPPETYEFTFQPIL